MNDEVIEAVAKYLAKDVDDIYKNISFKYYKTVAAKALKTPGLTVSYQKPKDWNIQEGDYATKPGHGMLHMKNTMWHRFEAGEWVATGNTHQQLLDSAYTIYRDGVIIYYPQLKNIGIQPLDPNKYYTWNYPLGNQYNY